MASKDSDKGPADELMAKLQSDEAFRESILNLESGADRLSLIHEAGIELSKEAWDEILSMQQEADAVNSARSSDQELGSDDLKQAAGGNALGAAWRQIKVPLAAGFQGVRLGVVLSSYARSNKDNCMPTPDTPDILKTSGEDVGKYILGQ